MGRFQMGEENNGANAHGIGAELFGVTAFKHNPIGLALLAFLDRVRRAASCRRASSCGHVLSPSFSNLLPPAASSR